MIQHRQHDTARNSLVFIYSCAVVNHQVVSDDTQAVHDFRLVEQPIEVLNDF